MQLKSYTDLEQSNKLAKILPLESVDMYYPNRTDIKYQGALPIEFKRGNPLLSQEIAAWSLAALFNVLPVIIGDVLSENALRLRMDKSETDFNIWYEIIDTGMVEEGFDIIKTNPVDACYEMILKLHELNLL